MQSEYNPARVWVWEKGDGKFANINRPESGAILQKDLPQGQHPIQLHSLATPNGVKVTIMLEELLAKGHSGAEYDAFTVDIMEGEQFSSGFVAINPNSKIPALVDNSGDMPIRIFESGSILLHLAEKFGEFLPKDPASKVESLNWLFWQMGSAPYLGGGFGHFYKYAPVKIKYCIDRFSMETKRQMDVLDKRLADNTFLAGEDYTIADIAVWPWYGALVIDDLYGAREFLEVSKFRHVIRWAEAISMRPAVKRGRLVNKVWGEENEQLRERHSASDFVGLGL
jgi:GSH-dependent disulfide-bond oxidoreductase